LNLFTISKGDSIMKKKNSRKQKSAKRAARVAVILADSTTPRILRDALEDMICEVGSATGVGLTTPAVARVAMSRMFRVAGRRWTPTIRGSGNERRRWRPTQTSAFAVERRPAPSCQLIGQPTQDLDNWTTKRLDNQTIRPVSHFG
jgi:hypothetical protein